MRDTGTTNRKGVKHWLMLDLIERQIQLRADQVYEERGHTERGQLEDWLRAQSEVLRTLNAD